MIDDSDVMSIVIDPANSSNVHATAVLRHLSQRGRGQNWNATPEYPSCFAARIDQAGSQHPDTLYAGTPAVSGDTNEGGEWKRTTRAILVGAKAI